MKSRSLAKFRASAFLYALDDFLDLVAGAFYGIDQGFIIGGTGDNRRFYAPG